MENLRGRTILIVQRNWPVVNDIAATIESCGGRPLCLPDAASALPFAYESSLSGAVLDGKSQAICEVLSNRRIPYVVYTGQLQLEDCGEGPIIRKPANSRQLLAELAYLIGR